MFRRLPGGLPRDACYPSDLEKLGYEVVTEKEQILSIDPPHEHFRYLANDNQRHNEVRCEAFHECIRRKVLQSLQRLGLVLLHLPQLTEACPPPNEPTIPILATPGGFDWSPQSTRSRVVVIINGRSADLGVFSYRRIAGNNGIRGGGMHDLIQSIGSEKWSHSDFSEPDFTYDPPGIVILNPGQTYFSHTHPDHPDGTAMTAQSWRALPRPSGLHEAPKVHPEYNKIPGNETAEAHLRYCFSPAVLGNPVLVHPEARLFIVATGDGADETLQLLGEKDVWAAFGSRINGLALAPPSPLPKAIGVDFLTPYMQDDGGTVDLEHKEAFRRLLVQRTRAWCLSSKTVGTPLANAEEYPLNILASSSLTPGTSKGMDVEELVALMSAKGMITEMPAHRDGEVINDVCTGEFALWPQVSGGEAQNVEDVLPAAVEDIAKWLAEVERAGLGYISPMLDVQVDLTDHADAGKEDWSGWNVAKEGETDKAAPLEDADMLAEDLD